MATPAKRRPLNALPVWAKPAAHTLLALPLFYLALAWAELLWIDRGSLRLSAEPVAATHNDLGLMAIRCLLLSLAVTPVRKLSGYAPIMGLRRMLGLWAFAYAAIHLTFYLLMELDWSVRLLANEVVKRNFIAFGMVGLVAMLPLALTSTRAAIKRLGGRNWQRLHRLAYLAGIAATLHFIFRVKGWQPEPLIYAAVLLTLFALRFMPNRKRTSRPPPSPAPSPAA